MNYITSGASSNQNGGIFMTEWFIWNSGILGSTYHAINNVTFPEYLIMFGRSWDYTGNVVALGIFYEYLFGLNVVGLTTSS